MQNAEGRGRQLFANKLHRQLFAIISTAALLPTLITTVALYFLIFGVTAQEVAIPDAISYSVIPAAQRVAVILLVVLPLAILVLLFAAHRITHRIVGPFDRIVRELHEHLDGIKKGPIIVREKDKFRPLVAAINRLLNSYEKPDH